VHPVARLVELEDAVVERFGLRVAVVVDVPIATSERAAQELAREAVAGAAVQLLADLRPTGSIGVSWGRTMLELARQLRPGWTTATEIVQLNGATSRSAEPTRANEIAERFGSTTGAPIRMLAAPAIVGSAELRGPGRTPRSAGDRGSQGDRQRSSVRCCPRGVLVGSGHLAADDLAALKAGSRRRHHRPLPPPRRQHALRELDDRTVGLPLTDLVAKPASVGLVAGAGRGPITLAALRGGFVNHLVADANTAQWVIDHG
jgi:DNA-binding transcriptional regulator LsrR (DeoR family)